MSKEKDDQFLKKLIDEASLEEKTNLNTNLEDLAWDSLAVITAIAVFDEVYSITLNAEVLKDVQIARHC